CIPRRGVPRTTAIELLLGRAVAILGALAVLGTVLPASLTATTLSPPAVSGTLADLVLAVRVVHVLREVVVVAVVDVDVAAAPVAVPPQRAPDGHPDAERQERRSGHASRRVGGV